jgi:hypothetical protein
MNDYQRVPHSLIVNWSELERVSNRPLGQWLTRVNSQINGFIQILRVFAEGPGEIV